MEAAGVQRSTVCGVDVTTTDGELAITALIVNRCFSSQEGYPCCHFPLSAYTSVCIYVQKKQDGCRLFCVYKILIMYVFVANCFINFVPTNCNRPYNSCMIVDAVCVVWVFLLLALLGFLLSYYLGFLTIWLLFSLFFFFFLSAEWSNSSRTRSLLPFRESPCAPSVYRLVFSTHHRCSLLFGPGGGGLVLCLKRMYLQIG